MYHASFLDHFQHPRGQGPLARATHRGEAVDAACGDRLAVDLDVRDGVVHDIRFRAQGCVGAIAVGSALSTLLPGRPFPGHGLERADLEAALGEVPRAKRHALGLALAAVSAAGPCE